jgi:hypothetical protein
VYRCEAQHGSQYLASKNEGDEMIQTWKESPSRDADIAMEVEIEELRAQHDADVAKIERLTSEVSRLDLVNFERTTENAALRSALEQERNVSDTLEAENAALKSALQAFDALIKHQYTGTQEAMSDLTYAAQQAARVLGEKK